MSEDRAPEVVVRDGVEGVIIGNGIFVPNDPVVKGALKPVPEMTIMEMVAGLAAIVVICLALWSMIITDSTIVIVAGIFSSITGCYGYVQQTSITDIKTLGETQEKIEHAVGEFKVENERLADTINGMEATMTKLQDVEKTYKTLVNMEGASIDNLESQIQQSKEILKMNKQSLKSVIIGNLLNSVSKLDKDNDNNIGPREVDEMINIVSNISGVIVMEEKLRTAIENKPRGNLMTVIGNISKYEETEEKERIFVLDDVLFQAENDM